MVNYPGLPEPERPYPGYLPPVEQKTSQLAIAALVVAIIAAVTFMCTFGVFSVAAVALGHLAMVTTKRGRKPGRWMAVAALVLGYITLGLSIAVIANVAGEM